MLTCEPLPRFLSSTTSRIVMSAAIQNLMKSTKSLAEVASKTVGSKVTQQYAKVMEANAKYVLEDKSKLAEMPKQYLFTHLAE